MKLEAPRLRRVIDGLLQDRETYQGKAREDLSRLWHDHLRPHRARLFLALAVTVVWAVNPYILNLTGRFLVDDVLRVTVEREGPRTAAELAEQLSLLRVYVIIIFATWSSFVLSHWIRSRLVISIGQKVTYALRKELHEKLQRLHIGFFEGMETGRLMSRVLDDVKVIRQWSAGELVNIAAQLLRLVLGLAIVLALNWKLGLIAMVTLPLYAFAFAKFRPLIRRSNIAVRRLNSTMYGRADERISGIAVVKAFGQERRERLSFAALMHNYVRIGMQIIRYSQILTLVAGVLTAISSGTIIYIGLLQVKAGTMTLGDVVVFIYALPNLFMQVSNLTIVATAIQAILVVIKRIFNILDEPEEVPPGQIRLDGMEGKIFFDHVSFTYPEQTEPALRDVTFNIAPGSKVALMGPSGSGKSTVFALLTRFYDPQEGAVRVGGVNLVDADPSSVRRHIRMVQQEPAIFSGTIAENISYGLVDATPVMVMEASKQAELHTFVMTLPVKYETMVGQNGVSLSGGQKQRLSLATALLTRPEVLMLDDTTSALDSETEARIRATLERVLEGRTSLIVTQRIATARSCDIIIVFEEGQVTQMGTHDQLVKQDGFYRRILEQQESI